ncbi:MAG: phosphatidate cytidylyltransferase [Deltaproteobacteria bacterium]|nr:phosphatidate cytidylyltransferase [Deltaproteobacteria bacterium]
MHLKRWLSGIAILPLLILAILQGGIYFSLFISAASLIALREYFRIVYNKTGRSLLSLLPVIGFITCLLIIAAAHNGSFKHVSFLIAINIILIGFVGTFKFKADPDFLDAAAKQIQGIIYVPLLLSHVILTRNGPDGAAWVFFLLFLVFFGDIGAYYAGSYFGRTRLCPSVSPGKTVEGALGGLVASISIGTLFRHFFLPHLSFGPCLLLFICVGIIAPVGDLFESMLKRKSDVKDSGAIMPGHGGLLDRIDAVLFAAPVVYYFKIYLM